MLSARRRAPVDLACHLFGANVYRTLPATQQDRASITASGLIGSRVNDAMGMGVGLAQTNQNLFDRPSELTLQACDQAQLLASTFLKPTVTYIPPPALYSSIPGALAMATRLTLLF